MKNLVNDMSFKGFKEIKEDKIHLKCFKCGRKQSNMPRFDDPIEAILLETLCPKCSEGCKDSESFYYNKNGKLIQCE